jgi:purine catabolism regulator
MLLENNPELETFQRDMLGKLLEQDNKQVLLETLEAYYQNGGNLSQTAETLFIHRNTLSYRLDRIREICNLDLNHPDTSLAMQIALRLYRMGKTG